MNITAVKKSTNLMDENYNNLPVFRGMGCGCCSDEIKITAETIETARQEALEWLEFLEKLKSVTYPET